MKNNYLFFNIAIAMVVGVSFFLPMGNQNNPDEPAPKNEQTAVSGKSAMQYWMEVKANQTTKTVDLQDVINAKKAAAQMPRLKSGKTWEFTGPNNFGGSTRALLIDNKNNSVLFAGSTSGGIWRSTSEGQYWFPLNYGDNNSSFSTLSVSCFAQDQEGTIYVGTGVNYSTEKGLISNGPSGFLGSGIYKIENSTSTNPVVSQLEATWTNAANKNDWKFTYEIAVNPVTNEIFAATQGGLMISKDKGATWNKAEFEGTAFSNKIIYDIAVAKDGSMAVASVDKIAIRKKGETTFKLSAGTENFYLPKTDVARIELAYSAQDPNYLYTVMCSKENGFLKGVYKSEDGGTNWREIGVGGSALFNPLDGNGDYAMSIAVNPINKNQVFVGGLNIWVGEKAITSELFDWQQVSLYLLPSTTGFYCHQGQHRIVFNPSKSNIFYIANDGGISKCSINSGEYTFQDINKNYSSVQLYSLGVNSQGHIIGGAQDNGSLLINPLSAKNSAMQIARGDGGCAAISTINPHIAFATNAGGSMRRNTQEDFSSFKDIFDDHFNSNNFGGAWVTPFDFWETDNNKYFNDSSYFVCQKDYKDNQTITLPSRKIHGAPIKFYIPNIKKPNGDDSVATVYYSGDTIKYLDPYHSLSAIGTNGNLWVSFNSTEVKVQTLRGDWVQVINPKELRSGSTFKLITKVKFSKDGNHLFAATNTGEIYRVSNLRNVKNYLEADQFIAKYAITTVTKIANFGSRAITGLSVDPDSNNPGSLIVTLGNYGNTDYIYMIPDAVNAPASDNMSKAYNITANLNFAPAYCSLFELNSNDIFVGTELGVYMANISPMQVSTTINNITWTAVNNNLGAVPVCDLKQSTMYHYSDSVGYIYAATFGRGLFRLNSYLVDGINEKENKHAEKHARAAVNVYPNPVLNELSINFNTNLSSNVVINIYNLSGQLVYSQNDLYATPGENTISGINISDLQNGLYLLQVRAGEFVATQRIIKQ